MELDIQALKAQLRAELLEELRKELGMAQALAPAPSTIVPAQAAEPTTAPPPEPIPDETIAMISAAIIAFLGVRVRIRSVRRMPIMGASAWAQAGRAYIQASHSVRHSE